MPFKDFEIRKAYMRSYMVEWRKRNRGKCRKWCRNWQKNHPNQEATRQFKRRKLGFIPLNQFFKGSVAHHVDKIHIVYIPKELHTSLSHNIWTGYNMEKINSKVFKWLKVGLCKVFRKRLLAGFIDLEVSTRDEIA